MRTYIKRANGDCWSGEEWINIQVVVGARDACDFETFEAAAGCLDAALASDTEGQFSDARVVSVDDTDRYSLAFAKEDGSWDIVQTFTAGGDDAANAWAEQHYAGQEWYVLDASGRNINGGAA